MKRNLIVTAALAVLLAGCGPTGKGNHTAAKPQSLASSTALSESTAASNSSADQASASASQNTSAPTPADESVEVGKEPVPAAIDYLTNNSAAKAALTDIPQDPSAYTVYDLSSKASITPKMTGVHAVIAPCSYARNMTIDGYPITAGSPATVYLLISYDGQKSIIHSAYAGIVSIMNDGYFGSDMLQYPTIFMPGSQDDVTEGSN